MNKELIGLLGNVQCDGMVGRQSVRTTFTVSELAEGILSLLSAEEGISEKDAIDAAVDFFGERTADPIAAKRLLDILGKNMDSDGSRKTRVVTRRSLRELERLAETLSISRDAALESVCRLAALARLEQLRRQVEALEGAEALLEKVCDLAEEADGLVSDTGLEVESSPGAVSRHAQDVISACQIAMAPVTEALPHWEAIAVIIAGEVTSAENDVSEEG